MRRVLPILLTALAMAVPLPAMAEGAATGALAELAQRLPDQELVRARFTQARHARAFSTPLVSTGRIVVAPGTGLLWVVEEPFPVTIALTPEKAIEHEEGMPPRITPVSAQPVFKSLMALLLDLPSGRADALADSFQAEIETMDAGWRLHLTPRDPMLAKAIAGIEVTGGDFISAVIVREVSGDYTEVRFTDQQIGADGLREEEAQAFRD